MKYQCEVCGSSYTEKGKAVNCEVECLKKRCTEVGHLWRYALGDGDSIDRRCDNYYCSQNERPASVDLTQADLADLWQRKTKAKEATP